MSPEKISKRCTVGRAEGSSTALTSVTAVCCRLVSRTWHVGLTRLLWGWRLHALGSRSILAHSLQVNNPRAVAIGSRVTIASQFVLADLLPGRGEVPKIVIGDGSIMLYRFQCNAAQSVRIGQNVLIASNVLITDCDHVVDPGGVPVTKNQKLVIRPVTVEDNCWLGQNGVGLKGVTIRHDTIVGANSVVTRDVPPRSVVAGNPARAIKELDAGASAVQRRHAIDRPE